MISGGEIGPNDGCRHRTSASKPVMRPVAVSACGWNHGATSPLLMAVGNSPDVLLLDEHTAALDPRTADNVMAATVRAVEAFGLTTLMVTHNIQHALDYGNRIVMMDAGQVRLELKGDDKRNATVPDLIRHFSVTTDRMLLGAHG